MVTTVPLRLLLSAWPNDASIGAMRLVARQFDLRLTHRWTVSNALQPDGSGGKDTAEVVFVGLLDEAGAFGIGEASPSARYAEDPATVSRFLASVDPQRLSFDDVSSSMAYLETIGSGNQAAKTAVNVALVDGAAKKAGQAVCDWLGLGFAEGRHHTSFSIGLDAPEVVREKVREAGAFPVLKLKLGGNEDRAVFAALRKVAPGKPVRVDANEGWKNKERALEHLQWLADDGNVQFVEQPLRSSANPQDMRWLRERSSLPLFADESCRSVEDIPRCAHAFDGVNVKLVKSGGIGRAFEILRAARAVGMKTMIGCMIESSLLTTAAAHLASLADYLDIDGNLLVTNDPFVGISARDGMVSFADCGEKIGLRVRPREGEHGDLMSFLCGAT